MSDRQSPPDISKQLSMSTEELRRRVKQRERAEYRRSVIHEGLYWLGQLLIPGAIVLFSLTGLWVLIEDFVAAVFWD